MRYRQGKARKPWGAKYGIQELYTDYRQLLARGTDIEAVDVCVHNNLHTPMAVAVMKAGKHCYSEKPMAGSYVDAKTLYKAASTYGVKLAIQCSALFNNQTRIAKKLIEARETGQRLTTCARWPTGGLAARGWTFRSRRTFTRKKLPGTAGVASTSAPTTSRKCSICWGCPSWRASMARRITASTWDERLLNGKKYEVEDLGVGLARFEGGLSMDIYQDWALNMDEMGNCVTAGSLGVLRSCSTSMPTAASWPTPSCMPSSILLTSNSSASKMG